MATAMNGVHYDAPLTDLSTAYIQEDNGFVGRKIFPEVSSPKVSDLYYVWDKDDFLRDEAQERAPNTEAAVAEITVATDPFYCKEFALAADIPWERRDNADDILGLQETNTRALMGKLMIKEDVLWASKFFAAGKWGTDVTGVTGTPGAGEILRWSESGSTPIEDIDNIKVAIKKATGYTPNRMVITPDVLVVLKNHPDILDRIKYTERGIVTIDLLAAVFGVDEVFEASAIRTTSKKGAATAARDFILGSGVLLAYAAPAPGKNVASAGYTFTWANAPQGAGPNGSGVRVFPLEAKSCDRIQAMITLDQRVVGADLGAFIATPV